MPWHGLVLNLTRCPEYKDDTQIIPRGTSVIVKRLPSARPGKGKAAMYIAGVGTAAVPTSEFVQRQGANINSSSSWHKGAMSKRFDVKEEPSVLNKASPVRAQIYMCSSHLIFQQLNTEKSAVANDDEQAAMEAMFQAQTANWEETQEKMSQLVSRFSASVLCSKTMSHERDLFFPPFPYFE